MAKSATNKKAEVCWLDCIMRYESIWLRTEPSTWNYKGFSGAGKTHFYLTMFSDLAKGRNPDEASLCIIDCDMEGQADLIGRDSIVPEGLRPRIFRKVCTQLTKWTTWFSHSLIYFTNTKPSTPMVFAWLSWRTKVRFTSVVAITTLNPFTEWARLICCWLANNEALREGKKTLPTFEEGQMHSYKVINRLFITPYERLKMGAEMCGAHFIGTTLMKTRTEGFGTNDAKEITVSTGRPDITDPLFDWILEFSSQQRIKAGELRGSPHGSSQEVKSVQLLSFWITQPKSDSRRLVISRQHDKRPCDWWRIWKSHIYPLQGSRWRRIAPSHTSINTTQKTMFQESWKRNPITLLIPARLGNIVHGLSWRLANARREWKSAFTQVWPIDETLWRMGFKASIRCWFGVLQRWSRTPSSLVWPKREDADSGSRDKQAMGSHANPYVLDNGVPIYGFIDLIVEHKDGTIELVDYKSNRAPKTQDEADNDVQAGIYLSWGKENFLDKPLLFSFEMLRFGVVSTFWTDKKIENFKSWAKTQYDYISVLKEGRGNDWRFLSLVQVHNDLSESCRLDEQRCVWLGWTWVWWW